MRRAPTTRTARTARPRVRRPPRTRRRLARRGHQPVTPSVLGLVESLIGQLDQPLEVVGRVRAGQADAGGDDQAGGHSVPVLGADHLADALTARGGRAQIGRGHEHEELLAAAADHDVGLAQDVAEQPGDPYEHVVSGRVAEAIVDRFEQIEVHDGQADRLLDALVGESVELAGQIAAVVQAGEPIALGLVAQLILEGLELAGSALELGVGLGEFAVGRSQRVALVAGGSGLERRALDADLQLGQLAEGLALELGGTGQRVVGLVDTAGAPQLLGQGGEDQAARLGNAIPSQARAPSPDLWASSK